MILMNVPLCALVTGATGFIGRNLVEELLQRGAHTVFCLVRNIRKAKKFFPQGVEFICADITDRESLKKVKNYEVDVIFHCAGYVENKNPRLLHGVNIVGTRNICELACVLGVQRVVYLSSVAVISGNSQLPLVEELPYRATNMYGKSKIEAEKCAARFREKGLKITILRPLMVYGEGEPHLLKFLLKLLHLRLLPLLNGGKHKFHLVYVKNVVSAMLYCLEREEFLKGTFFVADKEVLTQREVLCVLSAAIGAPFPFSIPSWMNPILFKVPFLGRKLNFFLKDRVYSIEKITSLGFIPPYSAGDSLTKSAQSYQICRGQSTENRYLESDF